MTPSGSREEEDDDYKGDFSEECSIKILNELKFHSCFKIQQKIRRTIKLLFRNAVNDSEYCAVYADILKNTMESIQFDKERFFFIKIIEKRLKWHFDNGKSSKPRDHSVFMGQLFIRRLISLDALEKCCQRLLESILLYPLNQGEIDGDSVICALGMFKIIGPFIDKEETGAVEFLDGWLQRLDDTKHFRTSFVTQVLITNLLELRANGWVSWHEEKANTVERRVTVERSEIYYGQKPIQQDSRLEVAYPKVIIKGSPEAVWRPDPAAIQIRAVLAKIPSLLDNVTAVNLNELTRLFISYTAFFNQQQLAEAIRIFFEKAVNGSEYCSLYADILKYTLESIQIDTARSIFIGIIERRLKKCFCCSKLAEARIHSVFMGNLFIRHLVSMDCLQTCCRRLLYSVLRDQGEIDEDSVICALEMFKIIGPFIDKEATEAVEFLDEWLQQLDDSRKFRTSLETQVLITNLFELRANGWEKEKLRTMSGLKRIIEEENGGIGKVYYDRESDSEVRTEDSSKNAWQPEEHVLEEETPIEDIRMEVRALLDKLTPDNLDEVTRRLISYNVASNEKLLVDTIFEKAGDDPIYGFRYADLCKLYGEESENGSTFLRALHTRIGILLQNDSDIRKYSLFIGHLYKSQVIQFQTLQPFFLNLFQSIPLRKITTKIGSAFMRDRIDEESIRIGIQLFKITGHQLPTEFLEEWFQKLENLQSFCSDELRPFIKDLMKSREDGWI